MELEQKFWSLKKHAEHKPGSGHFVPIPERVAEFAQVSHMYVAQIDGQRYFGPSYYLHPGWHPDQGSEVFVGRIPRTWAEPELVPFLEQVGPICQLRLMMNFSGTNRGYCFVKYYHPAQAQFAVDVLHGAKLLNGRPVVVTKSVDNRKLLYAGLPTFVSLLEIFEEIRRLTDGVVYIQPIWPWHAPERKGIAVVTFTNHREAAMARKKAIASKLTLFGFPISVDWAEPEVEQFNQIPLPMLAVPQVLRVSNLTKDVATRKLWNMFNRKSSKGVQRVKRVDPSQIFVFFKTRTQAEAAKLALNEKMVGGIKLVVEWADPHYLSSKLQPQF